MNSLEDPEDEAMDQDHFLNGRRNNANSSSSGKTLIQSGKDFFEPMMRFANSAPNPCPRLD
jgi:hypothetical protein